MKRSSSGFRDPLRSFTTQRDSSIIKNLSGQSAIPGGIPTIPARRSWAVLPTPVTSVTTMFVGAVSEAVAGVTVHVEFGRAFPQTKLAFPVEPLTGINSSK